MKRIKKEHLFIFLISGIGLIVSYFFNIYLVSPFYISNGKPPYDFTYYCSFLTHWTNFAVFVWYGLAIIFQMINFEAKFFHSTWVKGVMSSLISLVGLVMLPVYIFLWFYYTPIMLGIYSKLNYHRQAMPTSDNIYAISSLICNSFVHFLVPLIVFKETLKNGYSNKLSKKGFIYSCLYNSAWFLFYFITVLILLATNTIKIGPYPFLNFFNYKHIWQDILSTISGLIIFIIYLLFWYLSTYKLEVVKQKITKLKKVH